MLLNEYFTQLRENGYMIRSVRNVASSRSIWINRVVKGEKSYDC